MLSPALANEGVKAVYQVTNKKFFLSPVSQTFHGRDLFAPVAGYLMNGVPSQKLGSKVHDFVRLEWPQPRRSKNEVRGEILYIDHFGNAISNLAKPLLSSFDPDRCEVLLKRRNLCRLGPFYQAVRAGKAVAVLGSSGFLEIAVNGGSAARTFRLKVGDPVAIRQRCDQ